jgi:very-short-patch-repair endonuclease
MKERTLTYSEKSLERARRLRRESTNSEKKLWMFLRNNQLDVHFRRQAPCGAYVVDFLAVKPKLVVELDGSQHYAEQGLEFDRKRDAYLRRRGLTVLRFSNVEVMKNIDAVIATIEQHLKENLEH